MEEKRLDINEMTLHELEKEVAKYKGTEKRAKKVRVKLGKKEYLIPKAILSKYEVKPKGN